MKYIVDITKPPIPPPAPPCREMKGWWFPQETRESTENYKYYKQCQEDWDLYIQEYRIEANNNLHKQILNHLKQQENNIDFEI